MNRPILIFLLFCSLNLALSAQTARSAPAAGTALPAITFSNAGFVSSIQMSGSVTRIYGSDQQTGTVTLQASANGQSRMDLQLQKGSLIETQSASTAYEGQCTSTDFDGVVHAAATHNCWRGTVWFLPQLTLQSGAGWADTVASSVMAADGGVNLHLERHPNATMSAEAAGVIARFSSVDLKIDPSGQPVSLAFDTHPENDSSIDIPTEMRFSDYRTVSGVSVPFRIQKFINDGLVLDLQITAAQINPPAPAAAMAVLP